MSNKNITTIEHNGVEYADGVKSEKALKVYAVECQANPRYGFEESFQNLMSNKKLYLDQSFYSFVVAKMQIQINKSVPTAGAGFFANCNKCGAGNV